MFNMDTRLKQTPLPTPCSTFLHKNFSDGDRETQYNSKAAPTFGSLGLQNDPETESTDEFSTEPRLHEKQRQRKVLIIGFFFLSFSFS